jgi:CheY-like chemotaxis protein
VLIVDDNATNRRILREQLQAWHLEVDERATGPDALAQLRAAATQARPYRLLVLDMQMPGMSGLDVARAVRAEPGLTGVSMLLLTSVVQSGLSTAALECGITVCMAKPVRTRRLLQGLLEAAGSSRPVPVEEHPHSPVPATPAAPPPRLGRILAAEDNVVNKRLVAELLDKAGYDVDLVGNGAEAVEAASRVPYDAVLMDCQMPVMDGFEATSAIRAAEKTADRHTPIIALTASAMEGDRQRCLAAGMDDYLSKPIMPGALREMLERWVRPTVPVSPPIDMGEALAYTGGDSSLLAELLDIFRSECAGRRRTLRDALVRADAAALAQAAHAVNGTLKALACKPAVALASALETQARDGRLEGAAERVTELEGELDRIVRFIETTTAEARP